MSFPVKINVAYAYVNGVAGAAIYSLGCTVSKNEVGSYDIDLDGGGVNEEECHVDHTLVLSEDITLTVNHDTDTKKVVTTRSVGSSTVDPANADANFHIAFYKVVFTTVP